MQVPNCVFTFLKVTAKAQLTLVLDFVENDDVLEAISWQYLPKAMDNIAAVCTSLIFAK